MSLICLPKSRLKGNDWVTSLWESAVDFPFPSLGESKGFIGEWALQEIHSQRLGVSEKGVSFIRSIGWTFVYVVGLLISPRAYLETEVERARTGGRRLGIRKATTPLCSR